VLLNFEALRESETVANALLLESGKVGAFGKEVFKAGLQIL